MQTADTSNLFQSDAHHARASYRAAKALLHAESGDPIILGSKPLRVVVRQRQGREAEAWCAESGFLVRRVGLESGKTKQTYRGHFGPVTSLDFYTIPSSPATSTSSYKPPREVMISGSWDKSFRVWDTQTKTHLSTTLAHIDFVKALIVIPSLKLLVTGSSDKDLRIWDLTPLSDRSFDSLLAANKKEPDVEPPTLPESSALPPIVVPTGAAPPSPTALLPLPVLLSLKSHTRPIERLAYYRIATGDGGDSGRVALLSADSMGALKTWELWREADGQVHGELRSDIRPHEIGIYDLVVGDGEIWTASADNSVLLSTFDASSPSTPPIPTLRIPHPYYAKSVLSLSIVLPSLNSNHVLTGSADESIRIFDLAQVDEETPSGSKVPWAGIGVEGPLPGMVKEVEGHSHDVIELGVFTKEVEGKKEAWILSASVDGTLRRWKWPDVLTALPVTKVLIPVDEEESVMTAEEERELEEMLEAMDDD